MSKLQEPTVDLALAFEHDLDEAEYTLILEILGREPRPDERAAWRAFLDGFDDPLSAWQRVCRVLVSCNEFIYIE